MCSVSNKLVRLQSADEKVQKFQKYCRVNYKEFIGLHCFLRKLAKTLIQNGVKKMTKEEFTKEISNYKEIKDLHYFLLNV